jgi:RNA ligase
MKCGAAMNMDMDEIKKRIEVRLITYRKHPFLDLFIYNYTSKTQFDGLWDQYTERCRGLIMDGNGHVLNNPFRKFFDLGEKEYTRIENLPLEVPRITEKIDGMLGILYEEVGNVAIATRGSFDSPYAEWATNWLRLKGYTCYDFNKEYTYLFDIIYPDNKIIVDYKGRSELVLLAVRSNSSDDELDHVKEAKRLGLSYAKEYFFDKIDDAVKYLDGCKGNEFEGFVCKYTNGFRVKIKSQDYKRLHKLLTGISAKDVWLSLRDTGSVDSIIENVPDKFMAWVKKVEMELKLSKSIIMNKAMTISLNAKGLESRVEQFEYVTKSTDDEHGIRKIVLCLLDGRVDRAEFFAWQMIKPYGEVFSMK